MFSLLDCLVGFSGKPGVLYLATHFTVRLLTRRLVPLLYASGLFLNVDKVRMFSLSSVRQTLLSAETLSYD